ncbi:MAG: hypothetical protein CME60_09885 [Halobacteriovoraceae bacterium]|nr:hypothetical protein [Halobacteriovoraceae bacterium]
MKSIKYLGIGKNTHNSNATLLTIDRGNKENYEWTMAIQERFDRKKYSGQWPLQSLLKLDIPDLIGEGLRISENRDMNPPEFMEDLLNKYSPFFEMLDLKGLGQCSSYFNKNLLQISHHPAHAYAAIATLPFAKSYILVMDGGGNDLEFYERDPFHREHSHNYLGGGNKIEHLSLYFWDGIKLKLLEKKFLSYKCSSIENKKFSEGMGSLYEKAAELIFSDPLSSGKVMGLAGYGNKSAYSKNKKMNLHAWQEQWPWDSSFSHVLAKELGEIDSIKKKRCWENSLENLKWRDLAASVQYEFENYLFSFMESAIEKWSQSLGEHPLAMTGGCALNCTANFKLYKKAIFPEIYVSPFPGDESISLGTAFSQAYNEESLVWHPMSWSGQRSNYGINHNDQIGHHNLSSYQCQVFEENERGYSELVKQTAELLKDGAVVAWFQGQGECGPRALGHRSLLCRADLKGKKDYLNSHIKFREDFRPYGASVIWEEAHHYFDIPQGFQNPFMSFTIPVRKKYQQLLSDVTHVDGTCRMQTVMQGQNKRYYELLKACQKSFGESILLNTSLNIMGEPIVEDYKDVLRFFENSEVQFLVLDNVMISK